MENIWRISQICHLSLSLNNRQPDGTQLIKHPRECSHLAITTCTFLQSGKSWWICANLCRQIKWMGFRPYMCTCRINWARKTPWGWWDEWDDTALQTHDSKFEPWRFEAEHSTSRPRRLPTISNLYEWAVKKHFVSLKFEGQSGVRARAIRLSKQAALITAPGPPPSLSSLQPNNNTTIILTLIVSQWFINIYNTARRTTLIFTAFIRTQYDQTYGAHIYNAYTNTIRPDVRHSYLQRLYEHNTTRRTTLIFTALIRTQYDQTYDTHIYSSYTNTIRPDVRHSYLQRLYEHNTTRRTTLIFTALIRTQYDQTYDTHIYSSYTNTIRPDVRRSYLQRLYEHNTTRRTTLIFTALKRTQYDQTYDAHFYSVYNTDTIRPDIRRSYIQRLYEHNTTRRTTLIFTALIRAQYDQTFDAHIYSVYNTNTIRPDVRRSYQSLRVWIKSWWCDSKIFIKYMNYGLNVNFTSCVTKF